MAKRIASFAVGFSGLAASLIIGLAIAPAAHAQEPKLPVKAGMIGLLHGSMLAIKIGDDGTWSIVASGPSNTPTKVGDRPAPDIIYFKFDCVPDHPDQSLLIIENGYGKPFRYRAGLRRTPTDRTATTSACPVQAHLTNYESWPFTIDAVFATDFKFLEPGEDAACK